MPISPIIVPDNNGLNFNSNPESLNIIQFNPPNFSFYWWMSNPTPSSFVGNVRFPDFSLNPLYADHTDWLLEVQLAHTKFSFVETAATPFVKVEDQLSYSGSLGVLTDGFYSKNISFSFYNLNILSEGQYFAKATCKVTAFNPLTGQRETVSEKVLTILFQAYLFIFSTQPPFFDVAYQGKSYNLLLNSLTPMMFNYVIGGELPEAKELYYFLTGLASNANAPIPSILEVSDEIVETSYTAIHAYYAKLMVSFSEDITSLPVGVYDYNITVGLVELGTNPASQIVVPVQLHVVEETEEDLVIDPEELNFEATIGGPFPETQSFYVVSNSPWEIVSDIPSWLQFNYASGSFLVVAQLVNYSQMQPGEYNAQIVFANETEEVVLTVNFTLNAFLIHPFGNSLSFTKELDFIKVTSGNENTFLEITMQVKVFKLKNNEAIVYNRVYNLPLLNGKGEFHPGSIVDQLFEDLENYKEVVPEQSLNYVVPAYLPAEITISYEEKGNVLNPISGAELTIGEIPMFRMAKGHKPFVTSNNLAIFNTKQQELSRITPSSVICLPFLCFGNPRVVVKVNNIITEEFTVTAFPAASGSSKILFNYFRFNNNFVPGDVLEILIINGEEIRSSRYLVFPEGSDTTHVFFENTNGLMEIYELTGRRKTPINYEFTKKVVYNNLYERSTKATTKVTQMITVNAGKALPSDFKIINEIIKSKNVWLAIDSHLNDLIKVDATSNKLLSEDTFVNDNSIDLEFNILENSYAKVYPE